MRAALWAEWLKARRALPPVVVSAALTLGAVLIGAGMLAAGGRGNSVADAQLAPYLTGRPWVDLGTVVGVITAAGGLLGAGVLLSWLYGREFTDGTAPRLFASPTPRTVVAAAKLILFLVWAVALAIAVSVLALIAGLVLGIGAPDGAAAGALLKLATVSGLTSLLAMPCAWVATVSRGILAPVGTAVGLIVLAQVSVFAGIGAWLPFTAPGVWAGLSIGVGAQAVSWWQLSAVVPTAGLFSWLTLRAWHRLRF